MFKIPPGMPQVAMSAMLLQVIVVGSSYCGKSGEIKLEEDMDSIVFSYIFPMSLVQKLKVKFYFFYP
jgi:hypothetical protein